MTRFRLILSLCALVLLAACEVVDPFTPTPTREFTAPTLEPTADHFGFGPPTELPADWEEGIGQNDPTAAALPRGAVLPPMVIGTPEAGGIRQAVDVTAEDGTLLVGDLYQMPGEADGPRQPGVLLLATDRAAWGGFPLQLYQAGYTVLVMQIREGGGVADVRVMLEALASGIADPSRIAVIGASQGADLALRGCAVVPTCGTAVLLSPLDTATLNSLAVFNPRPLMAAASVEDEESYAVAQALHDSATGEKLLQPLENAGRGAAILTNRPDVGQLIITWLGRALG